MNDASAVRPYSKLPEMYALVALVVWIDCIVAFWPSPTRGSLPLCALICGALLSGAATHSWFVARTWRWTAGASTLAVTTAWALLAAAAAFLVGVYSGLTAAAVLVFTQVALCSFVVGHKTLRLTLATALVAMLALTGRLPLAAAGGAWVAFAILAIFLLAYDRTALKAGPAGFGRGEVRHTATRLTAASGVAMAAALVFLLTPMVSMLKDLLPGIPPGLTSGFPGGSGLPGGSSGGGEQAEAAGLGYGFGNVTGTSKAALSNVVVMTLNTSPHVGGPLYVRGQTFNTFDGVNWRNTDTGDARSLTLQGGPVQLPADILVSGAPDRPSTLAQTYQMRVPLEEVVFSVGRPTWVTFNDAARRTLTLTNDGAMRVDSTIPARSSYTVQSSIDTFSRATLENPPYAKRRGVYESDFQVPSGLPPTVAELAERVTKDARSPYGKALALEAYLRSHYGYSVKHKVGGSQVVSDFLFREKKGHCALFASSMAVMARSIGLPARYVTGFVAQDLTNEGFVIRGTDAHAWVDVFIDGAGWISFDPTSPNEVPGEGIPRQQSDGARPPMVANNVPGLYGREDMPRDTRPPGDRTGGQAGRGATPGQTGGGSGQTGSPSEGPQIAENGTNPSPPGGGSQGATPGDTSRPTDPTGGTPSNPSGQTSAPGTPAGTPSGTPSSQPSGTPSGTAGQQPGTDSSDPSSGDFPGTVRAPGGSTQLPEMGGAGGQGPTVTPQKTDAPKPGTPEAKAKDASDWRWLVGTLALAGIVGLVLLLIWKRGVKPAVERQKIRDALPLVVEEDPDPRRFVVKLYHTMVGGLGRVGFVKREADTPTEYALAVAAREPKLEPAVAELTEIFHRARYDTLEIRPEHADLARSAWSSIARSVDHVREPAPEDEL